MNFFQMRFAALDCTERVADDPRNVGHAGGAAALHPGGSGRLRVAAAAKALCGWESNGSLALPLSTGIAWKTDTVSGSTGGNSAKPLAIPSPLTTPSLPNPVCPLSYPLLRAAADNSPASRLAFENVLSMMNKQARGNMIYILYYIYDIYMKVQPSARSQLPSSCSERTTLTLTLPYLCPVLPPSTHPAAPPKHNKHNATQNTTQQDEVIVVYVSSVVSKTTILIPYEEAIAAAGVKARAEKDTTNKLSHSLTQSSLDHYHSIPQGRTVFQHAEQPLTAETLVRNAEAVGADFMVRNRGRKSVFVSLMV